MSQLQEDCQAECPPVPRPAWLAWCSGPPASLWRRRDRPTLTIKRSSAAHKAMANSIIREERVRQAARPPYLGGPVGTGVQKPMAERLSPDFRQVQQESNLGTIHPRKRPQFLGGRLTAGTFSLAIGKVSREGPQCPLTSLLKCLVNFVFSLVRF
jgi:hypothetical protein